MITLLLGSYFGMIGLAWAQLFFSGIALVINAWPNGRFLDCGIVRQIADLAGILFVMTIMAATVLLFRGLTDASPLVELLAVASVGALAYAGTDIIMRIHVFQELLAIVTAQRRRRPSSAGL